MILVECLLAKDFCLYNMLVLYISVNIIINKTRLNVSVLIFEILYNILLLKIYQIGINNHLFILFTKIVTL